MSAADPGATTRQDRERKPGPDELRRRLEKEQWHVTQEAGTERAFTGKYWDEKTPGMYTCICCDAALFSSTDKFDSGSGWPSFTRPHDGTDGTSIATNKDTSHGMERTEVTCDNCGAHLGHVFDDGPQPTGLRFCINSASLELRANETARKAPTDRDDA